MKPTKEELRAWTADFYDNIIQRKHPDIVGCFANTIARQPNPHFRRVLMEVKEAMEQGCPLSRALAQHPDFFDEKYITIVRYGEIHGELDVTLQRFLERPEEMEPRPCGVSAPVAG